MISAYSRYSARKNYDLYCGMDFKMFPVDKQASLLASLVVLLHFAGHQDCKVRIYSFGSSVKDYTLRYSSSKISAF